MSYYTNQHGASVLETMATLAIGGMLAVGGFGLYSAASAKVRETMINNLPKENIYDDIVFGPYSINQIFQENDKNAHIFLGDKCTDNFSCRRSFCGQIEIVSDNEVYVHIKNLSHCIKNMADY